MSSTKKRNTERFAASGSCFLLPTWRRRLYKTITNEEPAGPVDAPSVYHIWSLEGEEKYYKLINNALLSDDFKALKKHKVYRSLQLEPKYVQHEYKIGAMFRWPTFSSTSRDKDIAQNYFGNYLFEINISTRDGCTYCSDISQYSEYAYEKEVLIYPYSGFRVKRIFRDARIIQLDCVDTLQVESYSWQSIPEEVELFDEKRQLYVYIHKKDKALHFSRANNPHERFLIKENANGYWDTHYRYHHKNGYFINKGNNLWEEYHHDNFVASF